MVWLVIKDGNGKLVNRVKADNKKGLQRVTWDLRAASPAAVTNPQGGRTSSANLAPPGTYTAQLVKEVNGLQAALTDEVAFEVVPMREGTLPAANPQAATDWYAQVERLKAEVKSMERQHKKATERIELLRRAYDRAPSTDTDWLEDLMGLRDELLAWDARLNGSVAKDELRERQGQPTLGDYLWNASFGTYGNTYGGTENHRRSYQFAEALYRTLLQDLEAISAALPMLEERLQALGAPAIED